MPIPRLQQLQTSFTKAQTKKTTIKSRVNSPDMTKVVYCLKVIKKNHLPLTSFCQVFIPSQWVLLDVMQARSQRVKTMKSNMVKMDHVPIPSSTLSSFTNSSHQDVSPTHSLFFFHWRDKLNARTVFFSQEI